MFDCPRSEFAVNRCYRCSRLHVTQQPTFLSHLKTIYRMISAVGTFSDDVAPLFRAHFINFFSLRVAYKSDEHYEAIMSEQEQCLEFFVYGSAPSIMLTDCEVLLRVLNNFLWSVSKDFSRSQRVYFLDCAISFMNGFFTKTTRLMKSQQFEVMYLTYSPDIDYPLGNVRIINKNYIEYFKRKFDF